MTGSDVRAIFSCFFPERLGFLIPILSSLVNWPLFLVMRLTSQERKSLSVILLILILAMIGFWVF